MLGADPEADVTLAPDSSECLVLVPSSRSAMLAGGLRHVRSLFISLQTFAENDSQSLEFKSIQDSLLEIKKSIDPSNYRSTPYLSRYNYP